MPSLRLPCLSPRRRCLLAGATRLFGLSCGLLLGTAASTWAELPAPSVHWGAIAYPDRDPTLNAGLTLNRFTEFNGKQPPEHYNNIRQTMGFNMASVSWTHRWSEFKGWNTTLTVGAGPTGDNPTHFLQDAVHDIRDFNRVPVGATRSATDFAIDWSATRWGALIGPQENAFGGLGLSAGSLYYEFYGRAGLRRLSLADVAQTLTGSDMAALRTVSRFVRLSGMARYSRLHSGAAFHEVAPQSYLGQVSISLADYRETDHPGWELEFALTVDSGLFVDRKGDALEERFGSLALRFPYGSIETWNDLVNHKDYGPTFGASIMFDLLRIRQALPKM